MGTHNICLYKTVDKKYTDCNPKTMDLLDCALIGAHGVNRLNKVFLHENIMLCALIRSALMKYF